MKSKSLDLQHWLDELPDWERGDTTHVDAPMSPEPLRAFLKQLDICLTSFFVIQVVGSKGKGSVSLMLERLLLQQKCSVGTLTSPHVASRKERIRIQGQTVSQASWERAARHCQERVSARSDLRLSRFEVEVAMALLCFAEQPVQYAIVEAGLGGQSDATSACSPELLILTSIELEHTAVLGDTYAQIIEQKVGGSDRAQGLVVGPMDSSLLEEVHSAWRGRSDSIWSVGEQIHFENIAYLEDGFDLRLNVKKTGQKEQFGLPILGPHQAQMFATARLALEAISWMKPSPVDFEKQEETRLSHLRLPGRFELLNLPMKGRIVLDSAHTPRSVEAAVSAWRVHWGSLPVHCVCAFHRDKKCAEMVSLLSQVSTHLHLTSVEHPRSATPQHLLSFVPSASHKQSDVHEDLHTLFRKVRTWASKGESVLIIGSFTLVRAAWLFFQEELEIVRSQT